MRYRRKTKYPVLLYEMSKEGLSQNDIGKLLGIHQTTVGTKMCGNRSWTIDEINKLCEYFNKNFNELFKGE